MSKVLPKIVASQNLANQPAHDHLFQVRAGEPSVIEISESGVYRVELIEAGAHAKVHAAFFADQHTQVDVSVHIVHKAPHTSAETTLKAVATDQAKVRFFGRIVIEENCPGANSFLEERILLLSAQAVAEAVPELEILSNDVKCSHAASISPIPEEQLFYLQSRGLSKASAEKAVTAGFLGYDSESEDLKNAI